MWKAEARVNDWQEVYRCVDERRRELGMSWAAVHRASLSEGTFQAMKRGTPVTRPDNRVKICATLLWTSDSIDRILDGLAPEEISPSTAAEALEVLMARLAEQAALGEQREARQKQLDAQLADQVAHNALLEARQTQLDARLAEQVAHNALLEARQKQFEDRLARLEPPPHPANGVGA